MFKSLSRVSQLWTAIALLAVLFAPFALTAATSSSTAPQGLSAGTNAPEVDPNFIYTELDYMVTHFLKREAGYDNNLPPNINGHDEFANYWMQEMLHLLSNYGPQARRDSFPIQGWKSRPPTVPAFNVEITVPGVLHPEQIVVIGCHYDGMAFSSQSANDDGSGCAIELGVAKAMSEFWTKNHLYPVRTLRFVIFDAEEAGLLGSYHYVNTTTNGDLHNIVAMFNEEQNGIDYPLRYLGNMSNPLMPYYIDMSPLQSNSLYNQNNLSSEQRANISSFRQLMEQAVTASFQEFRSLGYQMLTYHGASGQDVWQPIFTPDQLSNIHLEDDTLGSSDQMPFTMAGLPCATLVGNSTYYDPDAPAGSYPYDQPDDTLQLMNTFADGTTSQSQALTMALALPGMITSWMLSQPSILGQTSADGKPIAAMNSLGQAQPGQAISFATAAYDPGKPGAALSYQWNFGDDSSATGQTVSHTYTQAGTYTLSLAVTSAGGARVITKQLTVGQPLTYTNPYEGYISDGMPGANPVVTLPTPTSKSGDRVSTASQVPQQTPSGETLASSYLIPLSAWLLVGMGALVIVIGIVTTVILRRRRRT